MWVHKYLLGSQSMQDKVLNRGETKNTDFLWHNGKEKSINDKYKISIQYMCMLNHFSSICLFWPHGL